MTIKDMEQLTGITRQNIRFYEREGLITPCRNPENQYREYSMEDAVTLKRIRLYRKLNVSIEDIRKLESRTLSLQSCMEQCISNTEKEMARMAKMKEVCEELRKQDLSGADPDVDKTLEQIEAYERSGYQFADISKDYWNMEVVNEIRGMNRQVAAALFISFMLPYIGIVIYFLLGNVPWMLAIPYTVIGYGSARFLWGRKNTAVLKKHIRAGAQRAAVCLIQLQSLYGGRLSLCRDLSGTFIRIHGFCRCMRHTHRAGKCSQRWLKRIGTALSRGSA